MRLTEDALSLCALCRHLRALSGKKWTCDAFPLGIPRAILEGRADHRWAFPGDDGLRFAPAADAPREAIALAAGGGPRHGSA